MGEEGDGYTHDHEREEEGTTGWLGRGIIYILGQHSFIPEWWWWWLGEAWMMMMKRGIMDDG